MMLGIEHYGSDSDDERPKQTTKRTKKFTIDLPKSTADEERPAKKARTSKGAGASGLLSMLPAPKQINPTLPPPERILGGGKGPGLIFERPSFTPTSVSRGKPNISTEESVPRVKASPFSIEEPSTSALPAETPKVSFSSAPKVEEFVPPEPTQQDPYPGYYLLPSGKYAAYETAYYQTFYKQWQKDYDKYVRDLEKGKVKGFEALDEEEATEANAMEEMEKAKVSVKELEERRALTKGSDEVQLPKMNIKVRYLQHNLSPS